MHRLCSYNQTPEIQAKIRTYSRVILLLTENDAIRDRGINAALGQLVRSASECNHWHLSSHFRSKAAALEMESVFKEKLIKTPQGYHRWCRNNLAHEHVVPTSTVIELLTDPATKRTEVEFSRILSKYSIRATITRAQNAELNTTYMRKMPEGFRIPGHELFDDLLARYRMTSWCGRPLLQDLMPITDSWYES